MKKLFAAITILTIAISGCSKYQTTQAPEPSVASTPAAAAKAESSAANSPAPVVVSASPSPSPSPLPSPEPETATKKYYMDKNYILRPLNAAINKKVVLLTFDDAPENQENLDKILQALDKHHAKAIFFSNGYRIQEHPELLQQIIDHKQVIGNHSWDHIDLAKVPAEKMQNEIDRVQEIVKTMSGQAPVFFRPPYAAYNADVKKYLEQKNILFMNWSDGSEDWKKQYQTPEALTKHIIEQLHNGANILMHQPHTWTADALDSLLTQLEQLGYEFADPRSIDVQASIKQQESHS